MMKAPKVRSLFGALFLFVLALPFFLMGVLRLYENALILETEHVLIVESVVVGEVYRRVLEPTGALLPLGTPETDDARYRPFAPRLDLATAPVLPPATRRGRAYTALEATRDSALAGPNMAGSSTTAFATLNPLLERVMVRNLAGMRVLDPDGIVVASPTRVVGYQLAHLPEVSAALDGGYRPVLRRRYSDEPPPPFSSISRAAEVRVSVAIPIFRNPRAAVGSGKEVIGVVYNARTPLEPTRALWQWRDKLAVPLALSFGITFALVALLSLTISRPLSRLRRYAERVAAGAAVPPHEPGRIAPLEIRDLNASIETMRNQLEARADYIREFAANAAHELKTPLTSIRGAAELLLEDIEQMTEAQRNRFLTNMHSDAVRMDGLVGRILELARIESSRPNREEIDLESYLAGVKERYFRRAQVVELSYEASAKTLWAVPDQLDSLLSNILDNAFRHGEDAPVDVTVKDEREGIILEVQNRGAELPEGHLDRVFERFYSTERAHGGTGLGLAIVKAVVEAHEGTCMAQAAPGGGAVFTVWWPVLEGSKG